MLARRSNRFRAPSLAGIYGRAALLVFLAVTGCAVVEDEDAPPHPNSYDVSYYTEHLGGVSQGLGRAVADTRLALQPNETARQGVAAAVADLSSYFEDWEANGWAESDGQLIREEATPQRRRWVVEPLPNGGYQAVLDVDFNGDGTFDDETDYGGDFGFVVQFVFYGGTGEISQFNHPEVGRIIWTGRGNENDYDWNQDYNAETTSTRFYGSSIDGTLIEGVLLSVRDGSTGHFQGSFDGETTWFRYVW